MSKVLYIKANARPDGVSRTFRISESFVKAYKEAHPEDEIITLDLYKEEVKALPPEEINELRAPKQGEDKDNPVLKYAYQFADADKFIIAAPMWNLSIPAILKAYIDYVSVAGITFRYTAEGAVGMCQGKKAVYIVTRGGEYSKGPAADYEMGERYLRTILGFFGIADFTTIAAEKLDVIGEDVEGILQKAIKDAENKAKDF